jgi:hypothetical protein
MFFSKIPFLLLLSVLAIFATLPVLAQQPGDPTAALNLLEQSARNSTSDISRLRIEKWKADGGTKRSAQADSDSIQRNMTSALPELISKVRTAPQDLNANFKLYRNLNVLYDVFSRFTETAGAFGARDDFQALAKDLDDLDKARRMLGDNLDSLSAAAQSELNQYRARARAAQAAAASAPPKKIVIDDSEPEKKAAAKKKKPAKPAASTTNGSSQEGTTGASGSSTPPK